MDQTINNGGLGPFVSFFFLNKQNGPVSLNDHKPADHLDKATSDRDKLRKDNAENYSLKIIKTLI